MPTTLDLAVANHLNDLRPVLISRVADQLAASLPMVGIDAAAHHPVALHHERMHMTAERFHDLVQLGISTNWELVSFEYGWTARVLGPQGITWDHQQTLLDAYFTAAEQADQWSEEERAVLTALAAQLRARGAAIYVA
jgi:hypothetical protein